MPFLDRLLIALPLMGIPFFVLAVLFLRKRWHAQRAKAPLSESYPRPPGESLRMKIQELESKFDEMATNAMLPPFLCVVGIVSVGLFIAPDMLATLAIGGAIAVAFIAIPAAIRLLRLQKELRDYRLGYEGERYVGQLVNQLMANGCRVFHDLQFDGFNIDHAVVHDSGIYAIETKTRRKPINKATGKASHMIKYDGERLHYPWGSDTYGLEQAIRNARTLAKWLTDTTGKPVQVQPILVFPGWFVTTSKKGPVQVLNPKGLDKAIVRTTPASLEPDLKKAICHQLKQKSLIGGE